MHHLPKTIRAGQEDIPALQRDGERVDLYLSFLTQTARHLVALGMSIDRFRGDDLRCDELRDDGVVASHLCKASGWSVQVGATVAHADDMRSCTKNEDAGHRCTHHGMALLVALVQREIGTLDTEIEHMGAHALVSPVVS